MIYPALISEIAKRIDRLSFTQQSDLLNYVSRITYSSTRESYRKNALREIRKALKTSADF